MDYYQGLISFLMSVLLISFFCILGAVVCFKCFIPTLLHKLNLIPFNTDFKRKFESIGEVLKPGETESFDFRKMGRKFRNGETIRIASYNIEDGKNIKGVIEDIDAIDPDILLLQEVDVFTSRVDVNTGKEIASALGYNYMNTCTKYCGKGYQGNAVLTKFDIFREDSIQYCCGMKKNPFKYRHSCHSSPSPLIRLCGDTYLQVVSLHLDAIYAGRVGRLNQLKDVFRNLEISRNKHEEEEEEGEEEEERRNINKKKTVIQIIGGDFNTISTGIARFCFLVSPDCKSIFGAKTEAEYLDEEVIRPSGFFDPWEKGSWCSLFESTKINCTMNVYSVFAGKVDWLLFPQEIDGELVIKNKGILEKSHSDHMLIWTDVQLLLDEE